MLVRVIIPVVKRNRICVNETLTVLVDGRPVPAQVEDVSGEAIRCLTTVGGYPFRCRVQQTNEGVTWVRGHHGPESPEVLAMLAAFHLR